MVARSRSACAFTLSVELLGDPWTLLILRDMLFFDRRTFRQLLAGSPERISSSVLANRLKRLVAAGMLTRSGDRAHEQTAVYSLTEKSISLFPTLVQISLWGRDNLPNSVAKNHEIWAVMDGGPRAWGRFMAGLRERHLGAGPAPAKAARSARAAKALQTDPDGR